jgi:hypothetical protein
VYLGKYSLFDANWVFIGLFQLARAWIIINVGLVPHIMTLP